LQPSPPPSSPALIAVPPSVTRLPFLSMFRTSSHLP
jgi:hypothetical protein